MTASPRLLDGARDETTRANPRPFLRWAGSKRWLVPSIRSHVPDSIGNYFEPFLGSGSIYFALGLAPERCRLSDSLSPLIECFIEVRDRPEAVHEAVAGWGCDRDSYYEVRQLSPDDPTTRAAQFIYLNRLCFNGLYRVNLSGRFNVPYGRPRFERIFSEKDELLVSSAQLRGADLRVADFEEATEAARCGDFVYMDPPYVSGHRNNGFVDYNARVFKWDDQRRLANHVADLTERGVLVLISNADHGSIRELYSGPYRIQHVGRYSSMSADSTARGVSQELLIANAPLAEALA